MKLSFKLILGFLFLSGYTSSQWYSIEDGTASGISQIKFKNENTGWYLSEGISLYKTTNGGMNWKCLNTSYIDTLRSMFIMINAGDTLWIPANGGRLLKSTNGGDNWSVINCNPNYKFLRFAYIKQNLIYAICENNAKAYLIKSTDTGLNWSTIYNFNYYYSKYLEFVNDSIGFLKLHHQILKTSNYGYNWQVIYEDSANIQYDYMKFKNPNLGFLEKNMGGMFRTTNGGYNWNSINLNFQPFDIIFENNETGYMTGHFTLNQFYKTTNGGANWNSLYSYPLSGYNRGFVELAKIGNTFYLNACAGGSIFKSTNDGINWVDLSKFYSFTNYNTIAFANSQTGFIGGSFRHLMKTTNSGFNWFMDYNIQIDYNTGIIKKIQFINEYDGWLLTDNDFYRTFNGGNNWSIYNTSIYRPSQFYFLNLATGWVTKDSSFGGNNFCALYKTTDYGLTFIPKGFMHSLGSMDIKFYDSFYGYACFGDLFTDTCLYRTTDGGNSWKGIPLSTVTCVDITTRENACIVQMSYGTEGYIYKTSNGGDNWYRVTNFKSDWYRLKFANQNTGFALNYNKNIYFTTNGGDNWIYSYIGAVLGLSDIYVSSGGFAIAVGQYGKIYRTSNYGGLIGINNISSEIPDNVYLFQNYPNPFNPITKIKYQIPKNVKGHTTYVILNVYDITGKKIETLVNENQEVGTFEVTFNGSNLPSGIYFYRLEVDGLIVETKKMILLK
jgi:photosystem II stability/assembly factor-like uncharacterized protein